MRVSEVFIPGGLPIHTYVSRGSLRLEEKVGDAKDNICKIVTVTGATKSGKTVLVRSVFRNDQYVWIDGGSVKTIDDFYEELSNRLEIITEEEYSTSDEDSSEMGTEGGLEANALFVKGAGKIQSKIGTKNQKGKKLKVAKSKKIESIRVVKSQKIPIIIDDFHYIPRSVQGEITRLLKPAVFEGVPVIFLAIPHRRFDAVRVEREMNGRISNVPVPMWSNDELISIAQKGFPLINIKPEPSVSLKLASEAQGSPHLMQDFCKNICFLSGVKETVEVPRIISINYDYSNIYKKVAEGLGKNIYEKLANGPRQRTDRKQRKLKNGKTADIYKVVLLALSDMRPDVQTVEYEELRTAMRRVLGEDIPQAHEVSRVLEKMAKVSSMDESSVPVIDYEKDERKLHITDPFFAFFLKWGKEMIES